MEDDKDNALHLCMWMCGDTVIIPFLKFCLSFAHFHMLKTGLAMNALKLGSEVRGNEFRKSGIRSSHQ